MNISEEFIRAGINSVKDHYFKIIKKIAKNSADFNEVHKKLIKCDTEVLQMQKKSSIKNVEGGSLSDRFTNFVKVNIRKRYKNVHNFNYYNMKLPKNKRTKIILKFIKNNK